MGSCSVARTFGPLAENGSHSLDLYSSSKLDAVVLAAQIELLEGRDIRGSSTGASSPTQPPTPSPPTQSPPEPTSPLATPEQGPTSAPDRGNADPNQTLSVPLESPSATPTTRTASSPSSEGPTIASSPSNTSTVPLRAPEPSNPVPTTTQHSKHGLPIGAIIGACIGALTLLVIAAVTVKRCRRRISGRPTAFLAQPGADNTDQHLDYTKFKTVPITCPPTDSPALCLNRARTPVATRELAPQKAITSSGYAASPLIEHSRYEELFLL